MMIIENDYDDDDDDDDDDIIEDENVLEELVRSRRAALSPSQYSVETPINVIIIMMIMMMMMIIMMMMMMMMMMVPFKENFTQFSEDGIPVVSREMTREK